MTYPYTTTMSHKVLEEIEDQVRDLRKEVPLHREKLEARHRELLVQTVAWMYYELEADERRDD
jgi:hypothetical protein